MHISIKKSSYCAKIQKWVAQLYLRVGILPTCGKHLHNAPIILLIEGDWGHKTSLTPPLFIKAPVPRQESERSGIYFASVPTIFL
jgi:hypothetical protein